MWIFAAPWTVACQVPLSMGLIGKNTGVRCHFFSSRGSSQLRDRTQVSWFSCIGRWILYHQHHLGSPLNLFLDYTVWSKSNKQCWNTELLGTIKHVFMENQQLIKSWKMITESHNHYKWWVKSEGADFLPLSHSWSISHLAAFPESLKSSNDNYTQPFKWSIF